MGRKEMRVMVIGGLIALAFRAAWAVSQAYGSGNGNPIDPAELRIAEEVLARYEAQLMGIRGVVGVGIGRTAEGDRTAIHVWVNRRAAGGMIPPAIPQQLGNVPVRVIMTDEIKAR